MDDKKIAISVKGIKKDFHLPHEKSSKSIKSAIVNMWRKKDKNIDIYHALKGISFEVKKGEFFGIVGRNGSGKSTLLKILAQIYQPTKGNIKANGKLVPFIELGVGFNPELSGRENVYLNGALLGFSREEIDADYDEIVEFAELGEFMEQKLKNYSSGMQVRLAFSVATRAKADILLIDEVLAVGDAAFQRKCYDYFKSLKKTDTTIVFVTHDMSAVREYCDRALMIENGLIMKIGDVEKVADEYTKLFQSSDGIEEKHEDRWGDGTVQIDRFISKITRDNISLKFTLKAKKDSSNFKMGYNFIDSSKSVVMGGNSILPEGGVKWFAMKQGETKQVNFTMPNLLGNGTYILNALVVSEDNVIYDEWGHIETISNSRENTAFYPIIAPTKMEVKDD